MEIKIRYFQVHYSYAVAAFDGLRKYVGSRSQTAIQICSVISCGRPGSVESCAVRLPIGKPTQERYIFHKLNLVAEILGEKKSFVMPNTLTRQLKSIESKKFQFAVREFEWVSMSWRSEPLIRKWNHSLRRSDAQMAELELSTPMDDIQTFAIYARDFRSDVNAALAADALLKTELRRWMEFICILSWNKLRDQKAKLSMFTSVLEVSLWKPMICLCISYRLLHVELENRVSRYENFLFEWHTNVVVPLHLFLFTNSFVYCLLIATDDWLPFCCHVISRLCERRCHR